MRCAQSFNLSHWTPQSVEYLLHIVPATARVPYKQAKNTIKANSFNSLAISMAKAMRRYSTKDITDAPCSVLQFKPLDTAIGRIISPYCPGDRQGPIQTCKKHNKKNASNSLAVSMAKAMRRYSTEDINQCVVLSASIEATVHRNRSNIRSILPRQPPRSHTSNQNNTIKQQNKHQDLPYDGTSQKRQMNCLLYFPRPNFPPKIDGHADSAQEANYQVNNLHSL